MMRTYEWIALGYFVYLAAAAVAVNRKHVVVPALTMALVPLGFMAWGDAGWMSIARGWAPIGYLLAGYWLPARLVAACRLDLEQRLLALDRRWLGARGLAFADRGP